MLRLIIKVAFVALFVGGYFALAVWGWGGPAAFFTHPALVALAAGTLLLGLVSLFVGGNASAGIREDRSNRWVLTAFCILGLLLAYLPAYCDRHELWTIDGDAMRWAGVVLFLAGGVLRLWPVVVLGHRFSGLVAIQPDHKLVTSGLYGIIRHPSYLGLLLNALGWALAFRSGVGVALVALILIPLIARINAEERLLASHFGADYITYQARTVRLLPGIY